MSPLIRPAAQADAAFLAESLIAMARDARALPGHPYHAFFPDSVTPREFKYALSFVRGADKLALIAQRDGRPAGCLLAGVAESALVPFVSEPVGHVAACWVVPEFRRNGIAKALAENAEAWFRERGLRYAELSWMAANTDAEGAWRSLGYAPFRVSAGKPLRAGRSV